MPAACQHGGPDAGHCVPGLPQAGCEAGGRSARQLCHVDEHVRSGHSLLPTFTLVVSLGRLDRYYRLLQTAHTESVEQCPCSASLPAAGASS